MSDGPAVAAAARDGGAVDSPYGGLVCVTGAGAGGRAGGRGGGGVEEGGRAPAARGVGAAVRVAAV